MFRERSHDQQQHQQHHKRSSTASDERKYRRLLSALWEKYQNEEQQVICMFPLSLMTQRAIFWARGVVLERAAFEIDEPPA